jgi:hypothetical protein
MLVTGIILERHIRYIITKRTKQNHETHPRIQNKSRAEICLCQSKTYFTYSNNAGVYLCQTNAITGTAIVATVATKNSILTYVSVLNCHFALFVRDTKV